MYGLRVPSSLIAMLIWLAAAEHGTVSVIQLNINAAGVMPVSLHAVVGSALSHGLSMRFLGGGAPPTVAYPDRPRLLIPSSMHAPTTHKLADIKKSVCNNVLLFTVRFSMRVAPDMKKSGYFWLPGNEEKKIPGTLIINDGGKIQLEIIGMFDPSIEGLHYLINSGSHLSRILGNVEEIGFVTLEDCHYKLQNSSLTGGIAKSLLHIGIVITRIAYDNDDELKFNTFSFSVDALDEWIGLTGIVVTRPKDFRSATITYNRQNNIIYQLPKDVQLSISFSYTLPGFSVTTEAKITQKCYFELYSKDELPLDDFISLSHKIRNLLSFAVDNPLSISDISVENEAVVTNFHDDTKSKIRMGLYYESSTPNLAIKKISRHSMLFNYNQIERDFPRILTNWIDAYENIDPALNLYFSTKNNIYKYLDTKFLALVQGLETLHRRTSDEKLMPDSEFKALYEGLLLHCPEKSREWLEGRLKHGNELSLRKRLKNIIAPFKSLIGNSDDQKNTINGILNTRNYLTHYDKSIESSAENGIKLHYLCQKMEAIFQLTFLSILGFNDGEILLMVEDNAAFQKKLNPKN